MAFVLQEKTLIKINKKERSFNTYIYIKILGLLLIIKSYLNTKLEIK